MTLTLVLAALVAVAWTGSAAFPYLGVLAAGLLALRHMPCGKAGMLVFFAAGVLVALSDARPEMGETAFFALLVSGWALLFLAYRRFALTEGGCSGGACRTG